MKTNTWLTLSFSFIILLNAEAQTKFSRFFWTVPEQIQATTVCQTSNGGFVIAGNLRDTVIGSLYDVFLAGFSSAGDTLWTSRIGGSGSESVSNVQQTNDGGYVVTGQTDSYGVGLMDIFLIKTDSMGILSWAKTYGNSSYDYGYSVRQNSDGGYIIAGTLTSGAARALVMRTNSIGDTLWTKKYGALSNSARYAVQTSDGGFIMTGEIDSAASPETFGLIAKLTPSGNIVWAKKLPSGGAFNFIPVYAEETFDGGYVVSSLAYNSYNIPVITKLDAGGNLIFGKTIYVNYSAAGIRATQLADSTYLVLAPVSGGPLVAPYLLIVKLNPAGDTLWSKKLIYPIGTYNSTLEFTADGGAVTTGYSSGFHKLDSTFNSECIAPVQGELYGVFSQPALPTLPTITASTVSVGSAPFVNVGYTTRRLYTPCTPAIPTCIVTVDSATQKNMVVWEENFDTTFIDSYKVYKETSVAGQYALIGTVPENQLSVFLDNASNPAVQSERYRVSALWNTYYEPRNLVAGHKTIHLSINLGLPPSINLIWSSYEGFSFSTYNIWRGNGSSAAVIASVPFGTNSYTDLTPPSGDSLYFIEVVHTPCNPTPLHPGQGGNDDGSERTSSTISSSRSNIANSGAVVGVEDITAVKKLLINPNPVTDELKIHNTGFEIKNIEVWDIVGQCAYNSATAMQNQDLRIDVSRLGNGVYFIILKTDDEIISKKFIVNR